jgi:hypothetical protein
MVASVYRGPNQTVNRYQDTAIDVGAYEYDPNATLPPVDLLAPTPPGLLTAIAVSTKELALTWAPSVDNQKVEYYRIYRNNVMWGIHFEDLAKVFYDYAGVYAGRTYTYTISAVDPQGNESPQSFPVSVTTPLQ